MINSKQKGKRIERFFVNFLKELGLTARRGQQFKGTEDSPDIIVKEWKTYIHIEVKGGKKLNIFKALQQAVDDKSEEEIPIVFYKQDHKEPIVILFADKFVQIAQAWLDMA